MYTFTCMHTYIRTYKHLFTHAIALISWGNIRTYNQEKNRRYIVYAILEMHTHVCMCMRMYAYAIKKNVYLEYSNLVAFIDLVPSPDG
jgi:hypothetical protein